jgi:hypothetical protein
MKIIKANYGGRDCTEQLNNKIKNDKLMARVSNDIVGDPKIGQVKFLEMGYEHEGKVTIRAFREGELISLPRTGFNKLGIFYSNNNNKDIWNAIYSSLNSVKIASEGKADIITCLWEDMPKNPFNSVSSWYRSQSHLNQLLQILQLLYTAKEMGVYDYVSFLEHDVLYPEGYFDFPDFENGKVLTNMNYGGLNKDGWQTRNQDDEPFHQMTMKFDDAIKHCLSILPNALKTNSGNIETQILQRIQWECKNEAIHINHGIHFTSHNSIYSKENTYLSHPYWGESIDYKELFNN